MLRPPRCSLPSVLILGCLGILHSALAQSQTAATGTNDRSSSIQMRAPWLSMWLLPAAMGSRSRGCLRKTF